MTRKGFVRRGNRRGGVFIDADEAIRLCGRVWFAYYGVINSAKKAMALYKKYGDEVCRRLAIDYLEDARGCRELCYALAGPRKIYREERP
jgi:hypothetical protein